MRLRPVSYRNMDYQTFDKFSHSQETVPLRKKFLPRRNWLFFIFGMTILWVILLTIIFTSLFGTTPIHLNFSDDKFLEIGKCPACYGVCLCPSFLKGDIVPESRSPYVPIIGLHNTRNVYPAKFKKQQVVLKKLGQDFELDHLDHHIWKQSSLLSHNMHVKHVSDAIRPLTHHHVIREYQTDLQGNNTYLVQHLRVFEQPLSDSAESSTESSQQHEIGSDMLLCPSQRKFRYIEDKFVKEAWGVHRLTALYNLMTILLFNSEPLVFQSFPVANGWPFPQYFGACGRFVVEEYVGPNLSEWLPRTDWKGRMSAALQMLQMARKFTEGVDGFRLYVTDVSLYNIAVNSNGSLRIVDAENIVVVDLDQIKKDRPVDYSIPYTSDNAGCEEIPTDPNCSSYSQIDMCTRLFNDHNYFAVCREIYSTYDHFGMLEGLPKVVTKKFPNLAQAQLDCFGSTEPGKREKAAEEIISYYSHILSATQHGDPFSL